MDEESLFDWEKMPPVGTTEWYRWRDALVDLCQMEVLAKCYLAKFFRKSVGHETMVSALVYFFTSDQWQSQWFEATREE